MAKVQKTVITALGEQMLFSSALTYTNATLCSQDISNLTIGQLRSLTDLTGKVLSSPISAHKRQGNTKADQVDVQVTFTNQDQKADINYSSIGWFARDRQGHETLIAVTPFVGTDTIAAAPPDGAATSSKNITLSMAAGTATEINVLIDPAGSVTPSTFNAEVDKINEALALKADNAELADYAKKADVNSALDAKADKAAVEQSLSTKANSTDVDDKLAAKADSADVTKQIKTITDLANTKADQTALDATNATVATKANSTDVYTKTDTDKLLDAKADKTALDPLAKSEDVAKDVETLNSAINLKADKTDLAPLAKTEDVNTELDKKADKTALDDYAKSSDVAADVKQLTDSIATKVDAKTVDDAIDKIDFTPYAKTADVQAELDTKANTTDLAPFARSVDVNKQIEGVNTAVTNANSKEQADLETINKALATKRDIADSYSRDELDKKFLQLSTDTSGKVSADQIAKLLASKVDKTDLTSQLQAITDSIGTKANSANVTAELAKKDNTADVDAKIKTVTDLANTKVDATYSYSKAELDKKLLALSTDTSGKVDADQVAQLIAGKADKDAVDKQIKAVTDSVATKANSDDVYSKTEANNLITDAKNTGKQAQATADNALAGYNKRPVISGGASDDLLSFKTTQLRYYPGNGNTCKNLPPATNQQWFTVEYIFENPNGDGIAIYRSPANEIWTIGNNGGNYDQAWVKVANANDIQGLQNQINTKLASGDLPTELQKITFCKQYVDGSNKLQDGRWKLVKQADGSYLVDLYHDDWTAQRVADLLNQIGSKADTATVNSQVADAKNAANKAQTTADNANNNANGRLSLNGGTMGSTAQISFANSGTWGTSNKPAGKHGGLRWDGQSDSAEIYADEDGSDNLDLVFQIGDDGSNHFSFRNQVGAEVAAIQSNGHYTGTIDWGSVNGRPDVATHADVNNKVNVNTPLFREISADSTWEDIFGVTNPNNVLTSLRINPGGDGQLVNDYAAGIGFGGNDTKAVISVDYGSHVARFTAGNGISPAWSEDVAWKSDISSLTQALTKLQAAFDAQQTKIAALQATVNNQANQLTYFKQHYIEGKAFDADQIKQAMAWTDDDGQKLAIIRDKENEGGKYGIYLQK